MTADGIASIPSISVQTKTRVSLGMRLYTLMVYVAKQLIIIHSTAENKYYM